MTALAHSEALGVHKHLSRSFDPVKIYTIEDRLLFEVMAPIQVNCKRLERFFKERFKGRREEIAGRHLPIRISFSAGPPLFIEEKVTKKLEVWSGGTIYLHLVKDRREVKRIAEMVELDIEDSDFPPRGHCMRKLCGERGYERWTFIKRGTNTKLGNFENNVAKLIGKSNFSVLNAKRTHVRGVGTFYVEYVEVRSLQIKPNHENTIFRVSVRDLFAESRDILRIFDWLTPSERD